jgi:LacI family transcriptional regulator
MAFTPLVTQRDVALACGVHPSTICLALGNSTMIPASTRHRIRQTAQRLGYRPNAAARSLAQMRNEKKAPANLPIAWINQELTADFWRSHPEARIFFEGARRQAAELGYYLDEFWVHERGMTLRRIAQIIHARGIEAVVFPVFRTFDPALLQPIWTQFSTIAFNHYRVGDWLDVVCSDYSYNTGLVLQELRKKDFKKIGLVLSADFDASTNGLIHSHYLRHHLEFPGATPLPACVVGGSDVVRAQEWEQWIRAWHPDAVLTDDSEFAAWAGARGLRLKVVPLRNANGAGIDTRSRFVAATAIHWLVGKARRVQRGFGVDTQRLLIKGAWENIAPAEAEPFVVPKTEADCASFPPILAAV